MVAQLIVLNLQVLSRKTKTDYIMEPQELKSHQQCETYYKVLIYACAQSQKFQVLQQDPIQYFNLYSDLCKYSVAFFNLLVGSKDSIYNRDISLLLKPRKLLKRQQILLCLLKLF
jgi:hypothetical protein